VKLSPDEWAASFTAALDTYEALRPRTSQKTLGISSLGHCASLAGFVMAGTEPTDAPTGRQAMAGTAFHEMVVKARGAWNPKLLLDLEVTATLPSGAKVIGHPDEIDPDEPSVTDVKTVSDEDALRALRRTGSSRQQQWQRHVYYLAAAQAGLVPPEGTVRNVWIDRAGQAEWVYVEQEPFSMEVVLDADRWMEDVAYAQRHGELLPQDKPFNWCQRFCEYFSACRAGQAHPDATITDPEFIRAAALVYEGRQEEKEAKAAVATGRMILDPLKDNGSEDVQAFLAGGYRVRWNHSHKVSGSVWRLDVEAVGA
jgi:hypothetical protein